MRLNSEKLSDPAVRARGLWAFEALWWLATAFVLFLVLFPILHHTNRYPFIWINSAFVAVSMLLAKQVFLLKYSPLATQQRLKIVLVFVSIPLVFTMISYLNHVIHYLDSYDYEQFFGHLETDLRDKLQAYVRTELFLFGVGSVLLSSIFPIRLMISIWRYRNHGRV